MPTSDDAPLEPEGETHEIRDGDGNVIARFYPYAGRHRHDRPTEDVELPLEVQLRWEFGELPNDTARLIGPTEKGLTEEQIENQIGLFYAALDEAEPQRNLVAIIGGCVLLMIVLATFLFVRMFT